MKRSESKKVVLGVTGSIAAYKSADIVQSLKKLGFRVSVVMSKSAERFITPLTFSSLSGEETYCEENTIRFMAHIELAKEATVFLIAPATANIIGKLAAGLADSLITSIALATKAPIIIAPAMNTAMYQNKIVQQNCEKLKENGFIFVNPIKGELACGDVGEGHIAEVFDIVEEVVKI